ncbi:pyridoxal phosphate-dependent aminotransferase [Rhizobium sp. TRM96647]|uniref:pyridoxal phosphate-dependent aminotransferase n=1 Tax=unclassified Rhizobium TaxID=2613769 RepID=UPI0021E7583B|nr:MULTISPECIES: pyridoxal phosphate-dependent aminotransferase [unclassified Rhizobium]MCV3738660.1 pyridoxal phosphate-dependent aminotransferase [Rhizobium sp. TRM96647]MCV3760347.1 pyridoxal phosphate-dependent aminotransferase [Rhizobium sp. TRM96650]
MNARLSPRMSAVGASPTAEISNKLRALAAGGADVINLGEGELDFATPAHVCDAGIAAIRAGDTKYTAVSGTAALKAAIARKFDRENGLTYKPSEIIAGTGAKQLIFNAFLATLDKGDEVIVPAPYWVSYPDMIRLAGATPVIVPCRAEDGWKLTPPALGAALTPKTRWMILNSPNNPTGAVYSRAELAALGAELAHHDALVMADDIYEHIVHDGSFAAPAAAMPTLFDRVLTINGVSKGYSMTGWRLGYAGGPEWLIRAMDVLQSQSTSNPSTIAQAATIAALDGDMSFLDGWKEKLLARRQQVIDAVEAAPGLTALATPGAFYVFADCTGLFGKNTPEGKVLETDLDVASYILEASHVGMVHGTAFGMPGHLRIAYAIDDARLATALTRITDALARLV